MGQGMPIVPGQMGVPQAMPMAGMNPNMNPQASVNMPSNQIAANMQNMMPGGAMGPGLGVSPGMLQQYMVWQRANSLQENEGIAA